MPIATRVLSKPDDGEKLLVRIFQPRAEHGGDDWACLVVLELENGNLLEKKRCSGIDAIQALQIAFSYVRNRVGDEFYWLGEPSVLGFPAHLPSTFGIDFYRSIAKLVSEVETEYVRSHQRTKRS